MKTAELLEAICALVDAGKDIPDDLMAEMDRLIDSGKLEAFLQVNKQPHSPEGLAP